MARKLNDVWQKKARCLGVLAIFKQGLGEIRSKNGYTDNIIKITEDCIDQFVKGVIADSFEELTSETK